LRLLAVAINMTVYILENKAAKRVKVGSTANTTEERLRAIDEDADLSW